MLQTCLQNSEMPDALKTHFLFGCLPSPPLSAMYLLDSLRQWSTLVPPPSRIGTELKTLDLESSRQCRNPARSSYLLRTSDMEASPDIERGANREAASRRHLPSDTLLPAWDSILGNLISAAQQMQYACHPSYNVLSGVRPAYTTKRNMFMCKTLKLKIKEPLNLCVVGSSLQPSEWTRKGSTCQGIV